MNDTLTSSDEVSLELSVSEDTLYDTCELCKLYVLRNRLAEHWIKDCEYFKNAKT